MLFEEAIQLNTYLAAIAALVIALFAGVVYIQRTNAVFYVSRKGVLKNIYKLPSVLLFGADRAGKTTLVQLMTRVSGVPHIKKRDIHISYPKAEDVQFVEPTAANPN